MMQVKICCIMIILFNNIYRLEPSKFVIYLPIYPNLHFVEREHYSECTQNAGQIFPRQIS